MLDLTASTAYTLYVVAASVSPGFPDMQTQTDMYKLTFTTKAPEAGNKF